MDKKTGYSGDVNFFCEEYSADYTSAKCNIGKGDELVFIKQGNGMYVAHYCADDKTKTLAFNRAECDECQCVIRWDDNGVRDIGELNMGCQFEDNNAHCFTYNGYEKKVWLWK